MNSQVSWGLAIAEGRGRWGGGGGEELRYVPDSTNEEEGDEDDERIGELMLAVRSSGGGDGPPLREHSSKPHPSLAACELEANPPPPSSATMTSLVMDLLPPDDSQDEHSFGKSSLTKLGKNLSILVHVSCHSLLELWDDVFEWIPLASDWRLPLWKTP